MMPGFFETLERDAEASLLARRLADGCPRCERILLPEARRQVLRGKADTDTLRRLRRRHRGHRPAVGRNPAPGPGV
jgi:hypothetical protein